MSVGGRLVVRWASLALLAPALHATVDRADPLALVARLADLGPRVAGETGYMASQEILLEAMRAVRLERVRRLPPVGEGDWVHLTGRLAGRSEQSIVLSAHYDTTELDSGQLDNATGVAAIVATAAELIEVPRRHSLQVLLSDGEERQAAGTAAWLMGTTSTERRLMLANLNVDVVGMGSLRQPAVLHLVAGVHDGRSRVSPAWLVHAVLRSAETSGLRVEVLDRRWSWLAQLSVRISRPVRISDGRSFVESGVPSVTLSDVSMTTAAGYPSTSSSESVLVEPRLRSWVRLLESACRRLDSLEDRPLYETEYLVLADRVWIRRDLVWVGFGLWILLVWRGLPGSWRHRRRLERGRAGRNYLPGFAFRMIFLLAVFLIPTFAAVLLYPVGVLALFGRPRLSSYRQAVVALAAAPTVLFVIWLTVGQSAGWFAVDVGATLPALLVILTLAAYAVWQLDPAAMGESADDDEGGRGGLRDAQS